jgi:hypothetical protein
MVLIVPTVTAPGFGIKLTGAHMQAANPRRKAIRPLFKNQVEWKPT